eukprot:TRINITY_DN583_c0_g1_i1.p1 TRINITY_DN583_c0_g1~~TRINITY_DN583_c0_g1_i1.p1  ORF type:complete len:592 (+),score=121.00 TRINITY_DN583_c0_g1_i1:55-1830(+)
MPFERIKKKILPRMDPLYIARMTDQQLDEYFRVKFIDDAEDDFNTGDILLCRGTEHLSHIIRKGTMSTWSHICLLIKDPGEDIKALYGVSPTIKHKVFVFECDTETVNQKIGGGTQMIPLYQWLSDRVKEYGPEVLVVWRKLLISTPLPTEQNRSEWNSFLRNCSDKIYEPNKHVLLKSAFKWNSSEDDNSFFCSKLVAAAYQTLGLLPRQAKLTSNYVPRDFSSQRFDGNDIELLSEARLEKEVRLKMLVKTPVEVQTDLDVLSLNPVIDAVIFDESELLKEIERIEEGSYPDLLNIGVEAKQVNVIEITKTKVLVESAKKPKPSPIEEEEEKDVASTLSSVEKKLASNAVATPSSIHCPLHNNMSSSPPSSHSPIMYQQYSPIISSPAPSSQYSPYPSSYPVRAPVPVANGYYNNNVTSNPSSPQTHPYTASPPSQYNLYHHVPGTYPPIAPSITPGSYTYPPSHIPMNPVISPQSLPPGYNSHQHAQVVYPSIYPSLTVYQHTPVPIQYQHQYHPSRNPTQYSPPSNQYPPPQNPTHQYPPSHNPTHQYSSSSNSTNQYPPPQNPTYQYPPSHNPTNSTNQYPPQKTW